MVDIANQGMSLLNNLFNENNQALGTNDRTLMIMELEKMFCLNEIDLVK